MTIRGMVRAEPGPSRSETESFTPRHKKRNPDGCALFVFCVKIL